MSKYIVELETNNPKMAANYTREELEKIFDKAQEVVEVDAVSMQYYGETENGKIHDKDGWHVKLYAAKLEEKK